MNDLNALTPQQLRAAADIQERIQALQERLNQLLGGGVPAPVAGETPEPAGSLKGRKHFSPQTRAKMAAAQKARWAAKKGVNEEPPQTTTTAEPKKKKVSEAKLKALAKAREARWAKFRAAKDHVPF